MKRGFVSRCCSLLAVFANDVIVKHAFSYTLLTNELDLLLVNSF